MTSLGLVPRLDRAAISSAGDLFTSVHARDRRGVTRAQRGSRCRHQKAGGFDRSQLVTAVAVVRAPMDSSESPPVV